jgi:hypothetical protein
MGEKWSRRRGDRISTILSSRLECSAAKKAAWEYSAGKTQGLGLIQINELCFTDDAIWFQLGGTISGVGRTNNDPGNQIGCWERCLFDDVCWGMRRGGTTVFMQGAGDTGDA